MKGTSKTGSDNQQKITDIKPMKAEVSVASEETSRCQLPKKCKFVDTLEFMGTHPPLTCRAFGDIILLRQNVQPRMCPFCLLHGKEEICYAKGAKKKSVCLKPKCKGSTSSGYMRFWVLRAIN